MFDNDDKNGLPNWTLWANLMVRELDSIKNTLTHLGEKIDSKIENIDTKYDKKINELSDKFSEKLNQNKTEVTSLQIKLSLLITIIATIGTILIGAGKDILLKLFSG